MDWREFKRQISYQAKSKFDLQDKLLAKHLTIGWDDYCRLPQEQQEMLESGTCIAHLCFALRTVPNLRRLVVTGFEPADSLGKDWEPQRTRYWNMDAVCPLEDCKEPNSQHLDYQVSPWSGFCFDGKTANPWSLAMLALEATGKSPFPSSNFRSRVY